MAYKKKRTFKKKAFKRKSYAKKSKRKCCVARRVEVKTVQTEIADRALYYPAQGASFDTGNTIRISPNASSMPIAQGTGQANRIGNKITTKRCMLNMTMQPAPYSSIFNPAPAPMHVKLALFYDKQNPTGMNANAGTTVDPIPRQNFFQFGNSATNISGNLTDIIAPFNKDRYAVLATKTMKLGYAAYVGSGSNANAQGFANNDFKLVFSVKWDITKYLTKTINFPDSSNDPSTRGLWLQVMPAQVGSTGSAGVIPLSLSYWVDLKYTDM